MGRNLPPGVSVSDLPGNTRRKPECRGCSKPPSLEAMEDGYPLCEDHDTEKARQLYDKRMKEKKLEYEAKKRREERNEPVPKEHREKEAKALAERYSEDCE